MKKNAVVVALVSLIFLVSFFLGKTVETEGIESKSGEKYIVASIVKIETKVVQADEINIEATVYFESSNEPYTVIKQSLNKLSSQSLLPLNAGDKVVVLRTNTGTSFHHSIVDLHRESNLFMVVFVFLILILLIARMQGIKTILSVGVIAFVVFTYFVPGMKSSANPYIVLLISCILIAAATFLILDGLKRKTLVSFLATILGVAVAMGFTLILIQFLKIKGIVNDDYNTLYMTNIDSPVNIQGIFFASVVIGTLGAIMDVAVSLTSSLEEIKKHSPNLGMREMFASGMRIGNDALSTMTATLLLAYMSGALPFTVLLMQYGSTFNATYILNSSWFVSEMIQSLVGVIALLLITPITVGLHLLLMKRDKEKQISDSSNSDVTAV